MCALRQRAIQLGWSQEHVVVIDNDLGQSGASAADRAGFQCLVAEVGLGRAAIVNGIGGKPPGPQLCRLAPAP